MGTENKEKWVKEKDEECTEKEKKKHKEREKTLIFK